MINWFKKNAGLIYIGMLTLILVLVLANSDELPNVLRTLSSLDVRWVWGAFGTMMAYLLMRATTMWFYLKSRGQKLNFGNAMLVSGIGQFYSAITPSASGGQPIQVLALHQRGIPLSMGTATVSIKFVGFQLAFLLMGGVLWASRWHAVADQLYGARWLVALGYLINIGLIVVVLLTMAKAAWVDRFVGVLVRLGVRLHLVKDEAKTLDKAKGQLEEYRQSLQTLRGQPRVGAIVFVLSLLQVTFLMGTVVCLYHAFKLTGTDNVTLLTLQFLLFITAAFVPLPGAAGAQEGGFVLFFRDIVPESSMLPMMLCWRFFTYYLLLIVGLIAVVIDAVLRRVRRRSPNG